MIDFLHYVVFSPKREIMTSFSSLKKGNKHHAKGTLRMKNVRSKNWASHVPYLFRKEESEKLLLLWMRPYLLCAYIWASFSPRSVEFIPSESNREFLPWVIFLLLLPNPIVVWVLIFLTRRVFVTFSIDWWFRRPTVGKNWASVKSRRASLCNNDIYPHRPFPSRGASWVSEKSSISTNSTREGRKIAKIPF